MQKKVIKFKDGKQTEEMCESKGIKLTPASTMIEEFWYEVIKDVFNYEMRREAELQEVHKLYEDKRILEGLELYKKGKVKEGAITDVDARMIIEGETGNHLVTLKKWKPLDKFDKPVLIRHRYQIEDFIAGMFFDCDCRDHMIHHYSANSSLCCRHIAAAIWLLQEKFNMPKYFIKPSEVANGYQKSNNIDLVKELKCLPMKKFTPFLNIVALREFRDIPTNLALSIHRIPNTGYEKDYPNGIPNVWCTITEPDQVEKLIQGILNGYSEMLKSRGNAEEDIKKSIKSLFPNGEEELKRIGLLQAEITKVCEEKELLKTQLETKHQPTPQKLTLWQKIKNWFRKT